MHKPTATVATDVARIALASLLAFFPGILLLMPQIAQSLSASIVCWLSFVLLFGVTLNTPSGRPVSVLAVGSLCVTTVMILVMLFQEVILCKFLISGRQINDCREIPSGMIQILVFIHVVLFVATPLATFLACYARPLILNGMVFYLSLSRSYAEMIGRNINLAIKVIIPSAFTFWLIFV